MRLAPARAARRADGACLRVRRPASGAVPAVLRVGHRAQRRAGHAAGAPTRRSATRWAGRSACRSSCSWRPATPASSPRWPPAALDVAYLGGLTYVEAERQVDADAAGHRGRPGDAHAALPVRGGRAVRLARPDRRGRRAAGGELRLRRPGLDLRLAVPAAHAGRGRRALLDRDGWSPARRCRRCGSPAATTRPRWRSRGGRVDAGGLELRVLHRLEQRGAVRRRRAAGGRHARGHGLPVGGPHGARAGRAGPGAAGLPRLHDPALLDLLRAEDYVAVQPGDYDEVRREATRLGLLR